MEIYAKSRLCKEQLDAKMSIGCDGIEIQLTDELIDGDLKQFNRVEDVFKLSDFNRYPIKSVHAPLLHRCGLADLPLEYIATSSFYLLEQVFKLANYFGDRNGWFVNIVVHSETTAEHLKRFPYIWDLLEEHIGALLDENPYTRLLIENVCPIQGIDSTIVTCNNYKWDNVAMAREMCYDLQTDRIGTVLDTCHAKISKRYSDSLCRIYGETEDLSLEKFLKENAQTVGEIHLADSKGSGFWRR